MKQLAGMAAASLLLAAGGAHAQGATASYKPTVDDWVGVNAAVNNYTLGLELADQARSDKAFWPDATIISRPEPGKTFTRRYSDPRPAQPRPPGGGPMVNVIGNTNASWHLAISHHFEFQSPTRATHYGYFMSVYPDLETKITVAGLPGHYDDVLEKRNGEWRILQRTTVIGVK